MTYISGFDTDSSQWNRVNIKELSDGSYGLCVSLEGTDIVVNTDEINVSAFDTTSGIATNAYVYEDNVDVSGITPTFQAIAGYDSSNDYVRAIEVNSDGQLSIELEGDVAHDSADSGNPIKLGGKAATSTPTAVADGDRVDAYFDEEGRLHVIDDGGSSTLPATHRNPQDFSVSYTSSTTITVEGAPFSVDDGECFISFIYYKPSGGSWSALVNGASGVSFSASSDVITVSGAGTPFASGDEYLVGIIYQEKAYSQPLDANQVVELTPLNENFVGETLVDNSSFGTETAYYYVDMSGFKHSSFQLELNSPSGTITATFEGTVQDDGTASSSCTYQDITNDVFGTSSVEANGGTISNMLIDDTGITAGLKYGRIKAEGLTDGGTVTIYHKRWY